MSFTPSGNPVVRRPARLRTFEGVNGPEDKVLRKTNEKGWDLSLNVANILEDFNLGRRGVMRLRHGCRKIDDTGKTSTISGVVSVAVSTPPAYAIIYGGTLDLVSLPAKVSARVDPIDLDPSTTFAALTSERITTWPGEQL